LQNIPSKSTANFTKCPFLNALFVANRIKITRPHQINNKDFTRRILSESKTLNACQSVVVDAALAVSPVGNERKMRCNVDGQADLAVDVGSENSGQPPNGQKLIVHESGQRQHEAAVERHLALEFKAEQLLANECHLHLVVQIWDHALHAGDQHSGHVLELGRGVLHSGGQHFVLNRLTQRLGPLQSARTKVEPKNVNNDVNI
jgi:hypothetical protein